MIVADKLQRNKSIRAVWCVDGWPYVAFPSLFIYVSSWVAIIYREEQIWAHNIYLFERHNVALLLGRKGTFVVLASNYDVTAYNWVDESPTKIDAQPGRKYDNTGSYAKKFANAHQRTTREAYHSGTAVYEGRRSRHFGSKDKGGPMEWDRRTTPISYVLTTDGCGCGITRQLTDADVHIQLVLNRFPERLSQSLSDN